MKKFFVGSLALLIALSAVALPKIGAKGMDYYWYKRTGLNTYVADGVGPNPGVGCTTGSERCAKGFSLSQTPSSITDATTGDTPDRWFH